MKNMTILEREKFLRDKVVTHGGYRSISEKSGVGYDWLCKFASNSIPNPGIKNLAKLEIFFSPICNDEKTIAE